MKAALTNCINNSVVVATSSASGYVANNIKEPGIKKWKSLIANVTVTATFTDQNIKMVALCNTDFTNLTINLKKNGSLVLTSNFTSTDIEGFQQKYLLWDLLGSYNVDEIVLIFSGTIIPQIGYLYASDYVDFGCIEKIQPFDNSSDSSTVSRANTVTSNELEKFQSFNITLSKNNDLGSLRSYIRPILLEGFSTPRVWILQEQNLFDNECVLAIMDSGKVGYDIFQSGPDLLAQTTIGLREVY